MGLRSLQTLVPTRHGAWRPPSPRLPRARQGPRTHLQPAGHHLGSFTAPKPGAQPPPHGKHSRDLARIARGTQNPWTDSGRSRLKTSTGAGMPSNPKTRASTLSAGLNRPPEGLGNSAPRPASLQAGRGRHPGANRVHPLVEKRRGPPGRRVLSPAGACAHGGHELAHHRHRPPPGLVPGQERRLLSSASASAHFSLKPIHGVLSPWHAQP